MTAQSEQALENGLISTLQDMSYEYVQIKEETNLYSNFKAQLEKHNAKQLAEIGRTAFTDKEFEKICIYLEGGTLFDKAKKLRDLYPLETEDGQHRVWVEFLNKSRWCQNEFQVSNQITMEGRKTCRYDVTILVNGLPLVQIELKKRGVELKQAYNQVQRYQKTSFRGLFDYIQLFVISNGVNTRYFANNPNCGYKFTFNWTLPNNEPVNDLSQFAAHFFDKCTLGKMISKYIVLHEGDKCLMVLRPYQYYAVEKILDRVQNTNKNGYIWHTTGAGKTLTSFKAAQLVAELDGVDKVLFVVDRHDLDTQTKSEYEAFEPGAVDGTDDTYELVKRLNSDKKIILTTIQKLNTAIKKDFYNKRIQNLRDKKFVMIFDECHRSHFGECHRNIVNFFKNLQIFGFTGTPIFPENAKQDITTFEVFGECLHKYMIKDAIADENVLGFLVEYYQGKLDANEMSDIRMKTIAEFIVNNFRKSTMNGEFNALFAVQSVPMLLKYYKIFKDLQPDIKIAAIFTYEANPSQDDSKTGLNQGFDKQTVSSDELQAIMNDYNAQFGTSFGIDNFGAYYDDINERMKKRKEGMESIDLLMVVGMFLTGFDAKKLNTLYVDKNLEYHGLLQAFSRTNRVLNEKKRFGKILCFRDLKSNVDESLKLFCNGNPNEGVKRPEFAQVKRELNELSEAFLQKYPTMESVDALKSEYDKKNFLLAFRDIIKKRAEIQIYEDFDADDPGLILSEQDYNDYRSKYLDMTVGFVKEESHEDPSLLEDPSGEYGPEGKLEDIDFCLELLHSDVINVAYILSLIKDLNPSADNYEQERKDILETMIKDASLRKKTHLIDGFIKENVDYDKEGFQRAKADGTIDLETRLRKYIIRKKVEAVENLAKNEGVDPEALGKYMSEYDYLGREKTEIIQDAVREKKMGLLARSATVRRIVERMREIFDQYNWE